ncbi:hypothetical protein MMC09_005470 [Bachmanniomyces sp. S44760]|nr:hypothetical protein [Bachmanniomyces sp. S44760]
MRAAVFYLSSTLLLNLVLLLSSAFSMPMSNNGRSTVAEVGEPLPLLHERQPSDDGIDLNDGTVDGTPWSQVGQNNTAEDCAIAVAEDTGEFLADMAENMGPGASLGGEPETELGGNKHKCHT